MEIEDVIERLGVLEKKINTLYEVAKENNGMMCVFLDGLSGREDLMGVDMGIERRAAEQTKPVPVQKHYGDEDGNLILEDGEGIEIPVCGVVDVTETKWNTQVSFTAKIDGKRYNWISTYSLNNEVGKRCFEQLVDSAGMELEMGVNIPNVYVIGKGGKYTNTYVSTKQSGGKRL